MKSGSQPLSRFLRLLPVVVLGFAVSTPAAGDTAKSPPPPAYTVAQKGALDVLDGVIARFEKLLERDNDAKHEAATAAVLDNLKQRSDALHQAFDQARYDELRVDLNLEYQRLASWIAPPTTPPPLRPSEDRRKK